MRKQTAQVAFRIPREWLAEYQALVVRGAAERGDMARVLRAAYRQMIDCRAASRAAP